MAEAVTVLDFPPIVTLDPSAVSMQVVLGIAFETPDTTAPVVDNFSPPNGTEIEEADPLFFDVTDDSGLFRRVLVAVEQGDVWELAYDGDSFLGPYDQGSTVTNIEGGFRFELRRDVGWVGTVTVRIFAIDQSGNEA